MTYTCEQCGTDVKNGVVIAGCVYCTTCSMSEVVFRKAQEEMMKGFNADG